jgi:hypothetical protein
MLNIPGRHLQNLQDDDVIVGRKISLLVAIHSLITPNVVICGARVRKTTLRGFAVALSP